MRTTVNIIEFQNEAYEKTFLPLIESTYSEMLKLLDNIPSSLTVKFTDGASDITGVGGFAATGMQINLAVLKDFHDKDLQRRNLRGVVAHETFHIQQGFTFDEQPFTALESAIYEGCAVVFEKQYGKGDAVYADYTKHTDAELKKWLDEIEIVGTKYFEDRTTWHKWAFYHPDYDERWILYKVGSWFIDRLLKKYELDVLDLKSKTTEDILNLYHTE